MDSVVEQRWAAVDWSNTSHTVWVVDWRGEKIESFESTHTAAGLSEIVGRLRKHAPIAGVAVETTRNLVVLKLLEAGMKVYPINPKLSHAWREGWKVAAPKSDPGDAEVLANGLREHHMHLHPLFPDDPLTRELAMLCTDEWHLIGERTEHVNRLVAVLKEYFPTALDWFSDWTSPSAWDFILAFPTPKALSIASRKKLIGFLKAHCIGLTPVWRQRMEKQAAALDWPSDEASVAAKSLLAMTLAKQLRTLEAALQEYRARIQQLFEKHPDAAIFSSLPGAGPKLGPRLLSVFGSQRDRYESAQSVQQFAGTVPVTKESGGKGENTGKSRKKKHQRFVLFRHACRKDYRHTLHLFASSSIDKCSWAQAFYKRAKAAGQSHALALRNLASKWLKIIFRMWKNRSVYDETIYLASLLRRQSPIAAAALTLANGGG